MQVFADEYTKRILIIHRAKSGDDVSRALVGAGPACLIERRGGIPPTPEGAGILPPKS